MKNFFKIIKENYKWVILLITSMIFIWFAVRVKMNPGLDIDIIFHKYLSLIQNDSLTSFFKVITSLASIPVVLVVFILFLLVCFVNKNYKYCPFVIANLTIILALNLILKQIFMRPRPELMLVQEFGYSFPSGHAMFSMAFYGLFVYIIFHSNINKVIKYLSTFLTLLIIFMIGLSRIYLHVHYLSDIIAGFAVSVIYLILFTKFMKAFLGDGVKNEKIFKSFYYAYQGIKTAFKQERNMKIHIIIMLFVIVFGFLLSISVTEWFVCLILFGIVIALELVNTAIENTVDLITKEYDIKAKMAKDTAAAAVLVVAVISVVVGLIIFIPKIFF